MLFQLVAMLNDYLATVKREEGQGMAEYALIIALVAIVLAVSLSSLEGGIAAVFAAIVSAFNIGG